jgi:hypothetical protein
LSSENRVQFLGSSKQRGTVVTKEVRYFPLLRTLLLLSLLQQY